ncbi:MAG: hypothetical protein H0T46_21265 [Deltaproteobacteria bacterium]|nr:hypothetical protein [Deltaproteobacteria bacterium]
MTRSAIVILVLAACGGSSRQVSQARYQPPAANHPPPPAYLTEATCADVATNLASLDLGNHADEEQLEPLLAQYTASCAKLLLNQVERQCVYDATDRTTVAWCAPRMMPDAAVAVVDPRDCPAVVEQLRLQIAAQPSQTRLLERQINAVQTSCERDRWPSAFGDCVRKLRYSGNVAPFCAGAAPAALLRMMNERVALVK